MFVRSRGVGDVNLGLQKYLLPPDTDLELVVAADLLYLHSLPMGDWKGV